MQKVKIEITGTMPLIMHGDTLADPLHPLTKEFKRVSGKRSKTDEDHEAMARMEFLAALYQDASGAICIPAANIKKCLIEGARVTKSGPKVERGVTLHGVDFPLVHSGPADPDDLYDTGEFVDRRSVKVGTARTMRVRPYFRDWSLEVECVIDPTVCSLDDLETIAQNAGNLIGLGDHRKIGGYGRFTTVVTKV